MALNIAHQISSLYGTRIPKHPSASQPSDSTVVTAVLRPLTPPRSGLRCRIKRPSPPELNAPSSLACRALAVAEPEGEVLHASSAQEDRRRGVLVYVMLPLDTVRECGAMKRRKAMEASLEALKRAGVEGVMVDVWWGIVERKRAGQYEWGGYVELMEICKRCGLKVQAVMSFHQCGGNVGDSVTIPLPRWVVEEMERDRDLCYKDQWGRCNYEYVSLGCDDLPVLNGRTPIQCYADFMRAFCDRFRPLLGSTIAEIQVGMGPAGEMRYPSYPELNGTWKFPGIGAFQCYDKYMLSSLKAEAEKAGKPEWGRGGPTDAGGYNNWPEDTAFFRRDGGWSSPYGEFFLSWYSHLLLHHGERILSSAAAIFHNTGVKISVKVAGIHWHFGTQSHAPELTAGYYNTRAHDGYEPIARMLGRHGAILNFTCIEMRDHEQPSEAQCRPEGLVKQVAAAARKAGVQLAGENALPRYDETAHDQIVATAAMKGDEERMHGFTYLRMGPELFQPENWRRFVTFVKRMKEGAGEGRCRELAEREAEQFMHATEPLVREAAVELKSS